MTTCAPQWRLTTALRTGMLLTAVRPATVLPTVLDRRSAGRTTQ